MSIIQSLRNKINDYEQTIHAIVCFMNLYRFNTSSRTIDNNVIVAQGRKLMEQNGGSGFCTPDICILLTDNSGVLGEVKKSFPKDIQLWMSDFEQLMSYDKDFINWPNNNSIPIKHDIVLIVHQTRAGAVRRFFEERLGKDINFVRPFIIVQFNESTEVEKFYFFQRLTGNLTNKDVNSLLDDGISIPMKVLLPLYSMIKIYDAQPPMPYLLDVIWANVVVGKALNDDRFSKLRKNQKIEVELRTDDILDILHTSFSFQTIAPNLQPKMPLREWVNESCQKLVDFNMAEWSDRSSGKLVVFFRKYDAILEHFTELCSQQPEISQPTLFDEKV